MQLSTGFSIEPLQFVLTDVEGVHANGLAMNDTKTQIINVSANYMNQQQSNYNFWLPNSPTKSFKFLIY